MSDTLQMLPLKVVEEICGITFGSANHCPSEAKQSMAHAELLSKRVRHERPYERDTSSFDQSAQPSSRDLMKETRHHLTNQHSHLVGVCGRVVDPLAVGVLSLDKVVGGHQMSQSDRGCEYVCVCVCECVCVCVCV